MKAKCNDKYQMNRTTKAKITLWTFINFYAKPTRKCIPFLALWTPIMNSKVNNGIEIWQNNATVESCFKTVKIDILEGDRRLKCGRFLKHIRERVMNLHKQMKYNIRKNKCTRALNFGSKSKQSRYY
ncbi:ULP PROTEASE domain-containing protein [Aphis craccivora]|uniref:ULP PROTEASE domain-containing protein n=1 Tax=Aphis craccivora TaxID=307492 RepID=A0A6G0XZZ1_APHCR|nr:ULP PROTEASE domain-containing protein [Aphis craccivora]